MKLNKYKPSLFLITDYFISLKIEKKIYKKTKVYFNYLFSKKIKIIRNFLYLYALIFTLLPFSYFFYQNNVEFKIKINQLSFLIIDNNPQYFQYEQ